MDVPRPWSLDKTLYAQLIHADRMVYGKQGFAFRSTRDLEKNHTSAPLRLYPGKPGQRPSPSFIMLTPTSQINDQQVAKGTSCRVFVRTQCNSKIKNRTQRQAWEYLVSAIIIFTPFFFFWDREHSGGRKAEEWGKGEGEEKGEREGERRREKGGRESESERAREWISSRLHTQRRAHRRAGCHDPWDHSLSWSQELNTQLTEPPGTPIYNFLKWDIYHKYPWLPFISHCGSIILSKSFLNLNILPF